MDTIRLKEFADRLDVLAADYAEYIQGSDTPIDTVLLGIVELLAWDRAQQTHPGVQAALDSAIDGLRHAAMDYYVSTK